MPELSGWWGRARGWLGTLTVRQWLLGAFLLVLVASFPFGGLRSQPAEATPALAIDVPRDVEPIRLTVTKVRYGDDLGVPQAAKIDGRYVVVFAKVSSTDEERSVPKYDALQDLLRIEGVPGVTRPFGKDPEPQSDALAPDTILVADDAEPMGDLAPGLTYTLAFVWRQAPGQPVPASVRVAAYRHTFRQASIDDTVDWRDPTRAAVGTFEAKPYEKTSS
ncbi:hypothetical protein SAMN04489867_0988 [Pedococcus dokdonensis]|uniref:Uncharacterized protein n=1 Tax=Pedococcus dokdonensis TaxID=443156 RepID=A0A1H0NNW0_9MICO|nr:hypothetical protein SAMN04489867_0988 [Pedococcus dokdonensis]